jgi:hypothetical protein
LIQERVKAMGVTPHYKMYEHDGVRGPNMATVFSDRGGGVRAPVVFYNRSNEAAQQLKPGDFDWPKIFGCATISCPCQPSRCGGSAESVACPLPPTLCFPNPRVTAEPGADGSTAEASSLPCLQPPQTW